MTKKYFGQRIYLRELNMADATQEYCNWLNDSEVNKFLETRKSTLEDLREYVNKKINDPNCFFAGIFDKQNNLHIGNVKLEPIDWCGKKAIFGILIGNKNYWGKGFGVEAAKLTVNLAFEKMGLKKIILGVISEHKSAISAYKKAGFKVEGIKKGSLSMSYTQDYFDKRKE